MLNDSLAVFYDLMFDHQIWGMEGEGGEEGGYTRCLTAETKCLCKGKCGIGLQLQGFSFIIIPLCLEVVV